MKYKIVCDFCGKEHFFSNRFEPPIECSNKACRNSLKDLEIIETEITDKDARSDAAEIINSTEVDAKKVAEYEIIGIELTYQKNGKKIRIESTEKIILGRNSQGSELLSNIPQISRRHCMIEFTGECFRVSDLASTNGTFVGLGKEKKDCNDPRELKEKDFLVLGEEVFLVGFIKEEKKEAETEKELVHDDRILCTECSCVLEKLPCICPECGAWNEEQ